jgi:cytoskeleton protein RodZ
MSKITRLNGGSQSANHGQGLHLRELPEGVPAADSVGQELRAARLRRGDELSQVSHALRIGKGYLEAIESDLPEKLPGRAYAIGFVRSYAEYVGLDPQELVARYKKANVESAATGSWAGPPEPERPRLNGAWIVFAVIVAGGLGYGLYQFSQSPPASSSTATPARPAVADRSMPRRHPKPANKVQQQLAAGRPAGTTAFLAKSAVDQQTPAGQTFGAQNLNARLVLRARALAHVLVQGPDGTVYINRLLHPGDVYRVPNLVGLSLTTPDGGAVFLELDGQDMGAAGKPGQIAEALSLDPHSIVERRGAAGNGAVNRVTP